MLARKACGLASSLQRDRLRADQTLQQPCCCILDLLTLSLLVVELQLRLMKGELLLCRGKAHRRARA